MFTGLIQATGTLDARARDQGTLRLTIHTPELASQLREGDSIAVSGVCLTALSPSDEHFQAELAEETIARTSLAALEPGALVNLELPTPAGSPLGGHIVQGHVDATGTLVALEPVASASSLRTDWWLRTRVPPTVAPFVVEKGSIAIEGISLTIAKWDPAASELTVAVIPHTYQFTNLRTLEPGATINLEADILMKLAVEKQIEPAHGFTPTLEYLVANGY